MAGRAFYRHGFSKGVLPALPRLREILSALGGSALPQSEAREPQHRAGRHLDRRHRPCHYRHEGRGADRGRRRRLRNRLLAAARRASNQPSMMSSRRMSGAVLSFGIAGGLAPGLRPGTVLIARSIVAEDGEQFECDRAWSQRLAAALGGAADRRYGGHRPAGHDSGGQARPASFDARRGGGHRIAYRGTLRRCPQSAFRGFPRGRRSGRTACAPAALAGISPTGAVAAGPVLRALARGAGPNSRIW